MKFYSINTGYRKAKFELFKARNTSDPMEMTEDRFDVNAFVLSEAEAKRFAKFVNQTQEELERLKNGRKTY